MNREKAKQVTRDRLHRWGAYLADNISTPVLLVGIGHGPEMGTVRLCATEDSTHAKLEAFLLFALHKLFPEKYPLHKPAGKDGVT